MLLFQAQVPVCGQSLTDTAAGVTGASPFARHGRKVAGILEDLTHGGHLEVQVAFKARPVSVYLSVIRHEIIHLAEPGDMVIGPRKQHCPRGRTC